MITRDPVERPAVAKAFTSIYKGVLKEEGESLYDIEIENSILFLGNLGSLHKPY
jgi:hypothetical protein